VYTDGEVPTNIAAYHGDLRELAARYEGFLGLYAFLAQRPKDVMLLGPGGGLDVWLALICGAKHIKGAEVNPSIPRIVRRFRNYAGPVYDFSNVDIAVAEGRSYLRRTDEKFDMIYMALTKTATTATTSMALIESYVYTVEAFRDYYQHLKPGGVFAFVCQASPLLVRETLTALQALQQEGRSREEAAASLAIASAPENGPFIGPYRHLLMVFHHPLTPEQARKLGKLAVGWGLEPVYFPGAYEPAPLRELKQSDKTIAELVKSWNQQWFGYGRPGLNTMPCTDDRPFVVDLTWGVPKPLQHFLAGTAAACFALMLLMAVFVVKSSGPRAGTWPVYFACLGVGFMLVEIVLIQVFTLYLGYPVLSLAVLLFSLLLGAGMGSLLSQRARLQAAARTVALAVGLLTVMMLALRAGAPVLFAATLGWDVKLRSLMTLALVLPVGLVMGIPFPTGVRRAIDDEGAEVVPWLWAVNGVASVVGSAAAMACAKLLGFSTTLAIGLAVYVLAAATILSARAAVMSPGD
ncbi:MAG: hypothetical protein J7M26_03285, partial [Armatimonadetes bacterium]|nr:hypothetical protein [Armatimonadota bacterium]